MSIHQASMILQREQAFFDEEVRELSDDDLRIAEDQITRYRTARPDPRNTAKDALFATLLPLEGQRVVDYGCGTGDLACELALCGAQVTAFDLSTASVAKARRRAELHGVDDRLSVDVKAAGDTGYPASSFDVATGAAVLHHLHTELPRVFAELDRILTPNGTACFIEPVANSGLLRALRRIVPVPCHATPDERQLRYEDFEPLRRYFPSLAFHHFYCLERLQRVCGERIARSLRRADFHLQRAVPFLRRCYGVVLVVARRQPAKGASGAA